jgi:hypothetical protein
MRNKNNVSWSLLGFAVCFGCTTAQQSASGGTSTSPNPATGASGTTQDTETAAQPAADGAPVVRAASAPGNIAVADIASQTVGAKVTVAGVFMGFNGACLSEAPSRSAWHLAASKEPNAPCVYVDGPFPPGLSPAVHAGSATTVTATVAELGTTRYLVSTGQ